MTELELQHLRREKWRLDGEPIRTLEEGQEFIDSVGMCLVYPVRPTALLPTLIGATLGSDQKLPTRANAFNDVRAKRAEELVPKLVRNKFAFEAQLYGERLLLSPAAFPYYYALASDRKPKQLVPSRARGQGSLLSEHVFGKLDATGPLTGAQLQQQLGGGLSEAVLERALEELSAALKITRIDHDSRVGDTWDVYYRWAEEAVSAGVRLSDAEALSALISKYLDSTVAATEEEIETFFSAFTSRSRVAEVVKALLAAREFQYTPSESRTLISVVHSSRSQMSRASREPHGSRLEPRRRNG